MIPDRFKKLADLDKEVVVVGMSGQAEIWGRSAWEGYHQEHITSFDEVAEEVYGGMSAPDSNAVDSGEG